MSNNNIFHKYVNLPSQIAIQAQKHGALSLDLTGTHQMFVMNTYQDA